MVVIRELFIENRFPTGWKLIPLIIYLPVGVVLATVRLFVGVQVIIAAALLHKFSTFRCIILRIMCAILGIFVFQENEEARDKSIKVVVTNHITYFDHLAINLLIGSISVNISELPAFFHFALNYRDFGTLRDKENLIDNVKRFINSDTTIDIQPEGAVTSGKKGLLRFSSWPCKLSQPIQPVALRSWRPPLMDISTSVISASWFSDFFWFLFVPFTVFNIKYLSPVYHKENESSDEMTKRLEKLIADDLKIEVTTFTAADKLEYEKRLKQDSVLPKVRQTPSQADPNLVETANRVKEVLPDVPLKVICAELARTKNVDVTISNFLEGLVKYTPEISPIPGATNKKSAPPLDVSQPSTSFDTSAKSFPKSAQDRMVSFQERKHRLIESARRRYIEKHTLNIMNSS